MQIIQNRTKNQPQPAPAAQKHMSVASPAPSSVAGKSVANGRQPQKNTKKLVVLLVSAAVVVLGGLATWYMLLSQIKADRYQAVFLNNGQVYFGKLHGYYGARPYLTDVHYFQVNAAQSNGVSSTAKTDQTLVKLGSEVHGPDGLLVLNKDAILFVENLSAESKVAEAIKKDAQSTDATIKPSGTSDRQ